MSIKHLVAAAAARIEAMSADDLEARFKSYGYTPRRKWVQYHAESFNDLALEYSIAPKYIHHANDAFYCINEFEYACAA